MTAWSIAAYIDGVAEAGKSNYNIPMFINVWMMEQNWWPLPGEAYPSGGAVTKLWIFTSGSHHTLTLSRRIIITSILGVLSLFARPMRVLTTPYSLLKPIEAQIYFGPLLNMA